MDEIGVYWEEGSIQQYLSFHLEKLSGSGCCLLEQFRLALLDLPASASVSLQVRATVSINSEKLFWQLASRKIQS